MEQGIYSKSVNSSWINSRGTWATHLLIITMLKLLFWSIPNISSEASWTITTVAYNLGSFIMFHWITGIPFEAYQSDYDGLTLWEQMDNGVQFTPTKKFLTATPIILFLISTHYTNYDIATFFINFMATIMSLIGKLPAMHKVRLFGINEISNDSVPANGKISEGSAMRKRHSTAASSASGNSEETLQ